MIDIDTTDAKALERHLRQIKSKAIPYAIRSTQNGLAFKGQQLAKETVKDNMINRNKFAIQSIQVDKARAGQRYSVLGSTQNFMKDQEFGGVVRDPTITTQYASGEGIGSSSPRKRLARKENSLRAIRLRSKSAKGKSRKQRNLVKIINAVNTGSKFIFLDTGKTEGIFKVVGGKKNSKKGGPKGAKLRMVQRTDIKAVTLKPNPWLQPSVAKLKPLAQGIYAKALQFQIKNVRL
jgi:hypothetical protein